MPNAIQKERKTLIKVILQRCRNKGPQQIPNKLVVTLYPPTIPNVQFIQDCRIHGLSATDLPDGDFLVQCLPIL